MKHSTKRAALLAGLGLAPVGAALAAGMTTHAHIADLGRQALPEGALKTLLTQHRPSLLAGAIHPDGGYGSGAIFPEDGEMAERAHWEDFNDAFIAHLQNIGCSGEVQQLLVSRQPLGLIDLNGLSDRCGKLIAFAFGNAAHGITDETWDSLFEPVVRERDLSPESAAAANAKRRAGPSCRGLFGTPADEPALRRALEAEDEAALAATLPIGPVPGIEYAMDVVAIVEQNLWLDAPLLVFPPVEELVAVHAINRPELGISAAQVRRGFLVSKAGVTGERLIAAVEAPRMRLAMPWAAANYYMTSGGMVDSARAVARLYEHLWAKLLDAPLPILVIAVHPENGERNVPVRRDAAQARIRAFTGQSAPEAKVEKPGIICLFDDQGRLVPGQSRSGIYDPNWGHVIDFTADTDLLPDHRYTVVVTDRLVDQLGLTPPSAYSWSFRTAAE